jgi:hypothetical protein
VLFLLSVVSASLLFVIVSISLVAAEAATRYSAEQSRGTHAPPMLRGMHIAAYVFAHFSKWPHSVFSDSA